MNKIIFILSFSILITSCGKQNGIPSTTQKEVVKTEQEKKEEAIANPYSNTSNAPDNSTQADVKKGDIAVPMSNGKSRPHPAGDIASFSKLSDMMSHMLIPFENASKALKEGKDPNAAKAVEMMGIDINLISERIQGMYSRMTEPEKKLYDELKVKFDAIKSSNEVKK